MPVQITDFIAQTCDGDQPWEAWANHFADEIVAHRGISWDNSPADHWKIAHRRTGRHLSGWRFRFATLEAALQAAAIIEPLCDWSQFGRAPTTNDEVVGLGEVEREALYDKVHEALSKVEVV